MRRGLTQASSLPVEVVEVASSIVALAPAPASTPGPASQSPSSPPVIRGVAAVVVFVAPPTMPSRGHLEKREGDDTGKKERATEEKLKKVRSFSFSSPFRARTKKNTSKKNEEAAAAREASRRRLRRSRLEDDALAAADGALVPGVPLRGWEVSERRGERERGTVARE